MIGLLSAFTVLVGVKAGKINLPVSRTKSVLAFGKRVILQFAGLASIWILLLVITAMLKISPIEKTDPMSDSERRYVAYHEAGHAIVVLKLFGSGVIKSINANTSIYNDCDEGSNGCVRWKRGDFLDSKFAFEKMAVDMAGLVASEHFSGIQQEATGAGEDIEIAEETAHNYLNKRPSLRGDRPSMAMDPKADKEIYLAADKKMKEFLKSKVHRLIIKGSRTSIQILIRHKRELDLLATHLIDDPYMTGEEVVALVGDMRKKK